MTKLCPKYYQMESQQFKNSQHSINIQSNQHIIDIRWQFITKTSLHMLQSVQEISQKCCRNHQPTVHYDNSLLAVNPNQQQIYNIYHFINNLGGYHRDQFNKLLKYLGSPLTINMELELVNEHQQFQKAIEQLSKDQYLIVQDYNQYVLSYKGQISCLLLANTNKCYLIDCLSLADDMHQLSKVFQHPNIVKFIYDTALTLQNIKRDFSIFLYNIFELKALQQFNINPIETEQNKQIRDLIGDKKLIEQEENKKQFNTLKGSYNTLSQYFRDNGKELTKRPLSYNRYLLGQIRINFIHLMNYVRSISKIAFFKAGVKSGVDQQEHKQLIISLYTCEGRINQLHEQLVKPYQHQEQQKLMNSLNNWNRPSYYYQLSYYQDQLGNDTHTQMGYIQEKLYILLKEFRSHLSKMLNYNSQILLPLEILQKISLSIGSEQKISTNNNISVLHIQQTLREYFNGMGNIIQNFRIQIWELAKQIYYLVQLNEEQCEEEDKLSNRQNFRGLGNSNSNIAKTNLKKLLSDLKWGNNSQWLNRKDDPSIKLYKQIVSIDQFDYSIAEEYISKINPDVLPMKDISKFLKYAQYMRNRKFADLQRYYEKHKQDHIKKINTIHSQDTEYYEEADEVFKNDYDDSLNPIPFINQSTQGGTLETGITLSSIKYIEKSITNKNVDFPTSTSLGEHAERSRKSSQSSSLKLSDLDDIQINRSQIKPLPDNLQEIYQLAMNAKRKAAKKSNRKKEKKQNRECGKEVQFIPSWTDIQNLLMASNQPK